MPSKTAIRVPLEGDRVGVGVVTGTVCRLKVGNRRIRCLIQDNGGLAHIRSGQLISGTGIQAVKVERMARLSTYHRTTDRDAAQIVLDRIVANMGADHVLARIDAAPVLNPSEKA